MNRLQGVQAPEDNSTFVGDLIDNIEERVARLIAKITPKERRYPPFLQFADTITMPASGFAVLQLKGPTKGRFWYVRKLRVVGSNPLASVGTITSLEKNFSGGGLAGGVATVPAGQTWSIQSIQALYTTDATVGNRTVQLVIKDPSGLPIYTFISSFNQPPSQSDVYTFAPGLTSSANGSPPVVTGPIPSGLILQPGSTITIQAQVGGAAGDTVTNGVIMVTQTPGNRADIYICPDDLRSVASLAQCPITTWRDQLTNLPQVQSYGVGELKVAGQELVNVAITGTAGTLYVASLEAYEWPDQDENVEWVI